jgi:hypothetical protein
MKYRPFVCVIFAVNTTQELNGSRPPPTVQNEDVAPRPSTSQDDETKAEYGSGRRELALNTPTYGYFNVPDAQMGYKVAEVLNSLYHSFGGRVRKLTGTQQHKYEFFYPSLIGKKTFLARIEAKLGETAIKQLKNVDFIYGEPDPGTIALLKKRKSGPFHPGEIQLQGSVWYDTSGSIDAVTPDTENPPETTIAP